jgi:hypothetical protein
MLQSSIYGYDHTMTAMNLHTEILTVAHIALRKGITEAWFLLTCQRNGLSARSQHAVSTQ